MLPPGALATIRRQLDVRLKQLNEEIRAYPQPIARCDLQLAGLIQERAELVDALDAVASAARSVTAPLQTGMPAAPR